MPISPSLQLWFKKHQRSLPWRKTADPYKIWLSEVILQQTRVDQGMPYYERFTETFPTISHLASAPDSQIMKLWQGLGYYSRARNLLLTARIINDRYKGRFPSDYQQIRNLPGIGDYTAAAITSFAYNQPYAVVDGNVSRVLSRHFGVIEPIDSHKGKKIIAKLASEELDLSNPGNHNQAIMEFGALQCKPVNPGCEVCPLVVSCVAFSKGLVGLLPVKSKSIKIRNRYFNYLLIRYNDSIYIKQRGPGDIWQNLFDFPLIETESAATVDEIMMSKKWQSFFGKTIIHINEITEQKVHKLSHQHIYTRVIDIRLNREPGKIVRSSCIEVTPQEAVSYAVPKIIENIMEEKFNVYLPG